MNRRRHLEREQAFQQASAWLNDLLLLEMLNLFESREERRELQRALHRAQHARDAALRTLEIRARSGVQRPPDRP